MGTVWGHNRSRRMMSLKHQGKAALLPSQTLSAQCLVNIERHCLLIDGHVSEASYKCKPCGFLFSKQNPIIYNLNQDPGSYPFQNCQIPLKKSRSAHRLNEGVFVHTECHFIYSFTHGLSFIFTLWLYVMSFLFSDLHGRGNSLSLLYLVKHRRLDSNLELNIWELPRIVLWWQVF